MNQNKMAAYHYQNAEDQEEEELNSPPQGQNQNPSMQRGDQKQSSAPTKMQNHGMDQSRQTQGTMTQSSEEMGLILQMMDNYHSTFYTFGFLVLIGLIYLIVLQTKTLKALRGSKKH